jgi:hypothetical protein
MLTRRTFLTAAPLVAAATGVARTTAGGTSPVVVTGER